MSVSGEHRRPVGFRVEGDLSVVGASSAKRGYIVVRTVALGDIRITLPLAEVRRLAGGMYERVRVTVEEVTDD